MPELPEIETFRRNFLYGKSRDPLPFEEPLVGKRVLDADLLWERTLSAPEPEVFKTRIAGQLIRDIGRRGKYLLLKLSTDVLAIHLRMSGDLIVESSTTPIAKHHRLLLNFDDGSRLALNDTRKFGRVWLTKDVHTLLSHLGPEPLDDTFTAEVLYEKLQNRRRQIKPLLLDQRFLAGMGNIYTDEALFYAALHPKTIASTIPRKKANLLWTGIRSVLQEGVRHNGASIDWVYRGGDFQNYFQVYHRAGEPCSRCKTPIEKIIVGQRSTHICPTCQKTGAGVCT
jgi:formamidopyrimidine-DNA glycosylase